MGLGILPIKGAIICEGFEYRYGGADVKTAG